MFKTMWEKKGKIPSPILGHDGPFYKVYKLIQKTKALVIFSLEIS